MFVASSSRLTLNTMNIHRLIPRNATYTIIEFLPELVEYSQSAFKLLALIFYHTMT